jgi:hypothetical protein
VLLIGSMLHEEHLGRGTLGDCFGGGYELAFYNQGFKKVSNILYLMWHMWEHGGRSRLSIRHGVRYSYVGDVLLMRMMDATSSYPTILCQEFEVFPVDVDPQAAGTFTHPPIGCSVVSNSIRIRLNDGTIINGGSLLITNAEERIQFSEEGGKFILVPNEGVREELRKIAAHAIERHKAGL